MRKTSALDTVRSIKSDHSVYIQGYDKNWTPLSKILCKWEAKTVLWFIFAISFFVHFFLF